MKRKPAYLFLMLLLLFALTACGDKPKEEASNSNNATPTLSPTSTPAPIATRATEPTATPTPEPTATPTPEPTEAPLPDGVSLPDGMPKGTELMFWFDGEERTQTLYFGSQGSGVASPADFGYEGARSIVATNRGDTWHGISLDIKNKSENGGHDIIGKSIYVSYMAYQDSGEPATISLTTAVTKPDGGSDWPAETRAAGEVPSGVWTPITAVVDIPSDISAPSFYWEATGTIDFYLDNILIGFVTDSEVGPMYAPVSFVESYEYDFEDGETALAARGSVQLMVTDDGYEGKSLAVSARTENWNGVQLSVPASVYAGKTVTVDCYISHAEAAPVALKASLEQEIAGTATYQTIASLDSAAPGEWLTLSGSIKTDAAADKIVVYFESDSPTASFSIDNVKISFQS